MEQVLLVDICKPKQWKTIPASQLLETGYPVYGANGKIGYYSEYTHSKSTVLITCRGATCGTVNVCEPKSYVNGNAMALDELDSSVNLQYLFYVLSNRGFNDVISGSAQPQITRQNLKKLKIPLPPLAEQKQIAAILDAADSLRQKDQQLVEHYTQLSQSLFLEMFGDPVINPMRWSESLLSEVCTKITDGTHQSPAFLSQGIPFLLVSNIVKNEISFETKKYISNDEYLKLTKTTPIEKGDILYTSVGSYGNPAIVKTSNKFCFQRHIAQLKPNHALINVNFLFASLLTHSVKQQADRLARGVAQKTLNLREIKSLNILLPPLGHQNQFAERIEKIEQQKQQAQANLTKSNELFNSLLQKAFTGELTAVKKAA